MEPAINRYNYSWDVDPCITTPIDGWGGARNHADRESFELTDAQADEINSAANFAILTDRTFQRHWTVLYERAGIAEHDAARFIGKLLDLVSKQARRAGGHLTAIWVREMGSVKGGHVHILLHLPPGMKLRNRTRRWIKIAGGTYCPQVSMMKRVRGTSLDSDNSVSNTCARANATNVARYLMKSSRLEKGQSLGLGKCGRGGRIIGKRMGSTQNIGKTARSRSARTHVIGHENLSKPEIANALPLGHYDCTKAHGKITVSTDNKIATRASSRLHQDSGGLHGK